MIWIRNLIIGVGPIPSAGTVTKTAYNLTLGYLFENCGQSDLVCDHNRNFTNFVTANMIKIHQERMKLEATIRTWDIFDLIDQYTKFFGHTLISLVHILNVTIFVLFIPSILALLLALFALGLKAVRLVLVFTKLSQRFPIFTGTTFLHVDVFASS